MKRLLIAIAAVASMGAFTVSSAAMFYNHTNMVCKCGAKKCYVKPGFGQEVTVLGKHDKIGLKLGQSGAVAGWSAMKLAKYVNPGKFKYYVRVDADSKPTVYVGGKGGWTGKHVNALNTYYVSDHGKYYIVTKERKGHYFVGIANGTCVKGDFMK